MRLDARRRQELRLLALGDVQQRRHQGDLHRRVGRRHAAALPRDRPARPGAPTRSSTSSTSKLMFGGYYKMPARADRHGELRRAQRLADPGAGPRHHGAGAGIRAACRCSTSPTRRNPVEIALLRSRPDRRRSNLITGGYWSTYWYNGHIYGVRDRARHRHLPADAERVPDAERDRRGDAGAHRRVQRAAAAEDHLAGDDRRRRPRDLRLVLRVELGLADLDGRIDLVLRQVLVGFSLNTSTPRESRRRRCGRCTSTPTSSRR